MNNNITTLLAATLYKTGGLWSSIRMLALLVLVQQPRRLLPRRLRRRLTHLLGHLTIQHLRRLRPVHLRLHLTQHRLRLLRGLLLFLLLWVVLGWLPVLCWAQVGDALGYVGL